MFGVNGLQYITSTLPKRLVYICSPHSTIDMSKSQKLPFLVIFGLFCEGSIWKAVFGIIFNCKQWWPEAFGCCDMWINIALPWGKKIEPKLFCSHFMSFYPIPFIFRGCIGENQEFYWVPRNFGFWPTNEIFSRKRKKPTFQKWPFLGCDVENRIW